MAGTGGETDKKGCVWERLLVRRKEGETVFSCVNRLGASWKPNPVRALGGRSQAKCHLVLLLLALSIKPDLREQVLYMQIKIPTFICEHKVRGRVSCKLS